MFKPLLVAAVVIPLLQAAHLAEPAYQAANVRISTDYQADKVACAPLAAPARELCYEQARARKKVARAELEYSNGGNARDHHKLLQVRAEADVKDLCIQQAEAVQAQAVADVGQVLPLAAPRPDGVRVQHAVAEPRKPAAAPFKAVAL
jgi:hypothetical protein